MLPDAARIDRIVDDLYAGALDAEAWQRGLQSIARLIGGQGPFLLSFNPSTAAVLRDQIFDYDPKVFHEFREKWSAKDIRIPAALEVPVGRVMTERTMLPSGEWERCEAYNEFFRVNDAPWLVTAWLHKSPDKVALFSVQATRSRGPFDEQDIACIERIVPHVRRALAIKDRLESDVLRTSSLQHALEHAPFGTMLLDESGRVLDASAAAVNALTAASALGREPGGRYVFRGVTGAALHRLISSGMREGALSDGQLHVDRGPAHRPLSLLVTRLPLQTPPWFSAAPRWVMLVFDPDRGLQAAAERIQADLGVSAREAEVAALIADGLSIEDVARRLHISVETARCHLKSVFSKTDVHSQLELVRRILAGPAMARRPDRPSTNHPGG